MSQELHRYFEELVPRSLRLKFALLPKQDGHSLIQHIPDRPPQLSLRTWTTRLRTLGKADFHPAQSLEAQDEEHLRLGQSHTRKYQLSDKRRQGSSKEQIPVLLSASCHE